AVAATGHVPPVHGAELSQELELARQRLRAARGTNLASEPTRGPTWQRAVATHRRRVAALEGLANHHAPTGGTPNLTDNPKLMSPARLRAQIIALEDATNPQDVRRLKALRKAAEERGIDVVAKDQS